MHRQPNSEDIKSDKCEHYFGLVFKELKIQHWECSKCGYLKDLFGKPKEKA